MHCDFIELAAPGVRALRPYQPGKPESELRRELGLERIIKLASNENPLGPSPRGLAAARDSLTELARYPDGNGFELKAALARHHGVDPAAITLGNGSNDVLELLGRAFLTPVDEVVFSQHAFAVYPLVTQAVGAAARVAPAYGPDHAMAYGHDPEALLARVGPRTRLMFIANPNNPTGTWLEVDAIEALLQAVPPQVLVVIDEAYGEYAPHSARVKVPEAWLARFPNLVITHTFSKIYGLAGLRVGYALSHPQVADLLNRVRQPFNVNSPALAAARAALDDTAFLEQSRQVNHDGMAYLQGACRDLGLVVLPSLGNFLCVGFRQSGRPIFEGLLRRGVIVRPVDNYGLPDFLRVSIGTAAENQVFVETLRAVLAEAS